MNALFSALLDFVMHVEPKKNTTVKGIMYEFICKHPTCIVYVVLFYYTLCPTDLMYTNIV